jgi:hypothetical protein
MARHIAAHLRVLMFLTTRLMSILKVDDIDETDEFGSSTADTGDNSTWRPLTTGSSELWSNPESEAGSDRMDLDETSKIHDAGFDIPDAEDEVDWSGVALAGADDQLPQQLVADPLVNTRFGPGPERTFNSAEHHDFLRYLSLILLRQPRGDSQEQRQFDFDESRLSAIEERLIHANLRRRHRFLWAQKNDMERRRWRNGHVLDDQYLLDEAGDILASNSTLDFPRPPPPLGSKDRRRKCPCCCQTFFSAVFTDRQRWM